MCISVVAMVFKLFPICLVIILLPNVGFTQDGPVSVSNSSLNDIESYELQIMNLESAHGPMDQRLIEPLNGLIARLTELGQIDQVAELQTKQLAIMRANLGFESLDLLPVLRGMIQVQQALGNWEATSDILDHIRFLMASNYDQRSEETLFAMENQAQWKLAGFYLDAERNQSNNFLDARNLYADMERLAEDVYGKDSPQLYPWYYKRAYNLGIMVQLLNTKGGFANVFITDVIRSDGTMRLQTDGRLSGTRLSPIGAWNIQDRNFVLGEGYLRQARDLINRIRKIAEIENDLEVQAIAEIYRGDYNLLMGRGSGRRQYDSAQDMLLEAGVAQAEIDEFFGVPMLLPLPRFFDNFSELLEYQRIMLAGVDGIPDDALHLGIFNAWHENARAVLKPTSDDPLLQIGLPQNLVDLKFNINTRGRVSSVDSVRSVPDDERVSREASRAIREVRFRPAYVDRKAIRVRGAQIRYLFAQELR